MGSQAGTPVPIMDREQGSSGSGPVIEYKLSPDELEKIRAETAQKPKKKTEFNMTREQYLEARAAGKSRMNIVTENYIDSTTLKGYLIQWGLLEPANERAEIEKLRPQIAEPSKPQQRQSEEKAEGQSITKEFVLAEFAKGKSASQIEREQGMKKNSIFYYLGKLGIRSPYGPAKKANRPVENAEQETPEVEPFDPVEAARIVKISPRPKMVTLRIPIIDGNWHPIEQRVKVQEELDEFATEIEASNMNRERAASELFDLIQSFIGLIRADLTDLLPGQDVTEHVQKFFDYHNHLHEEKIKRYAAERGWKVG